MSASASAPGRPGEPGPRSWRALAAAGLVLFFVWNALYFWPYVVDDAFISFRYARNLALGQGLVYNPGERVEGYSNFLWVLLAAGVLALGGPLVTSMKVAGLAAGVATLLGSMRLAQRIFAGEPASRLKVALAAGLLGTHTSLAVWSQAGLETPLFAALLVGAVGRFELERREPGRLPGSALLFGLAWLTRPEAPTYALYFAARRFLPRGRPRLGRADLGWLAVLAALVVPFELFGLVYYGELLPQTHGAKLGREGHGLLASDPSGSLVFRFALGQGGAFAGLLALGALGCLARPGRVPKAAWVPASSGLLFALYAWSDWMPRYRLLVPCLPFLFLLLAHGLGEVFERARGRRVRGALGLLLASLLAGALHEQLFGAYGPHRRGPSSQFAARGRGLWWSQVPAQLGRRIHPLERDAWRILRRAPEHEPVGLADIGFPGFLTGNPIWDVRGLVTPAAARARNDDSEAARRALVDDLLRVRPLLLVLPLRRRGFAPAIGRVDRHLRADARVTAVYRRERAPEGDAILYLRRAAPPYDPGPRIAAALARFPEYASELARRETR